jgi:hypothetical protein
MIEAMQPPTTRAEYEQGFHLLAEQDRQGRNRGLTSGIEKVRYLPNGRVDLLSINELARLNANMMSQFNSGSFKKWMEDAAAQDEAEKSRTGRVDKKIQQAGKIGRNDPCPCGSGTKYKKCCGK